MGSHHLGMLGGQAAQLGAYPARQTLEVEARGGRRLVRLGRQPGMQRFAFLVAARRTLRIGTPGWTLRPALCLAEVAVIARPARGGAAGTSLGTRPTIITRRTRPTPRCVTTTLTSTRTPTSPRPTIITRHIRPTPRHVTTTLTSTRTPTSPRPTIITRPVGSPSRGIAAPSTRLTGLAGRGRPATALRSTRAAGGARFAVIALGPASVVRPAGGAPGARRARLAIIVGRLGRVTGTARTSGRVPRPTALRVRGRPATAGLRAARTPRATGRTAGCAPTGLTAPRAAVTAWPGRASAGASRRPGTTFGRLARPAFAGARALASRSGLARPAGSAVRPPVPRACLVHSSVLSPRPTTQTYSTLARTRRTRVPMR